MSLSLDSFDRTPSRITAFLAGKPVEVRSLAASEMDALRRVLLKPAPEMVPNPLPGGSPAFIPDELSPRYAAAIDVWVAKMQTAIVAVAADIEGPGGKVYTSGMSDKDLRAYVDSVVVPMRARFSDSEIGSVYELVSRMSDPMSGVSGEDRIEAAKKNLSGLSPSALAKAMESLGFSPTNTASPVSS